MASPPAAPVRRSPLQAREDCPCPRQLAPRGPAARPARAQKSPSLSLGTGASKAHRRRSPTRAGPPSTG
eukprot:15484738-Alexandrium_andersonii.AAC.1